jgi:hypothetical protein
MDNPVNDELSDGDVFDPNNLRLTDELMVLKVKRHGKGKTHKSSSALMEFSDWPFDPGGPFIPNVPWSIFERVTKLPGRAWIVMFVIWRECRLNRCLTVRLTNKVLGPLGVDKFAKRQALKVLVGARLIKVKQIGKQSPAVTIVHQTKKETEVA